MENITRKIYLGDGAYAEWRGEAVKLTTNNGLEDTNTIILEPEVLDAFQRWVYVTTRKI